MKKLEQASGWLVLATCSAWIIFQMIHAEIPADTGDGIQHFFISQASWQHPELFLDHWGKPLFILLSSSFAQFGFNGMVLFNLLIFILTCLMAFRYFQKLQVPFWLQLLFPPVLLLANDISRTILGGLTEPLFNLSVILALLFYIEKRYLWFTLLISFLPFLRSEGQLPILLAAFLLIMDKKWKYLPLLTSGFLAYAVWGKIVLGDFWWYFTQSPYKMANGIYGKGTWDHYLLSYKNYLGNPGLYLLILGTSAVFYLLFRKRWAELRWKEAFFVCGLFFGVVAAHSYFWATGQNGSMGLTRIATQGVPAFLTIQIYYISRMPWTQQLIAKISILTGAGLLLFSVWKNPAFPVKATPMEQQVLNAAASMKQLPLNHSRIYYHYPLFALAFGENPYLNRQHVQFYYGGNFEHDCQQFFKNGDYLVRDSHFGPVEAGLPLEKMKKCPNWSPIQSFVSTEQINDQNQETADVVIYRFTTKNSTN